MDDPTTDHAAMQQAALQVEAKHQQIHMLQRKLQRQMMELSTRWQGTTFAMFERRYSRFDTELERVKQGLEQIHTSLMESSNPREQNARVHSVPGPQARRFSS